MAAAELPSWYGQEIRGGTIVHRSGAENLAEKAGTTDMALSSNNQSTPSTPTKHILQDRLVNDLTKGTSVAHSNFRQRRTSSKAPSSPKEKNKKPYKLENGQPKRRSSSRRRRDDDSYYDDGDEDDDNDSDSDSIDSEEYRRHRRRRHLRRKLKRKHEADVIPLRIPWTKWMHSDTKNHFVAFIGEFVGTTMFLFFAFAGTQVANIGSGNSTNQSTTGAATGFNPTVYLYIALCFGFSLVVNAWVFFRISGGLFNPAVTLALSILGALHLGRAIFIFIAQLTGACFAAYLVKIIFPTTLNVRTTLAQGTSVTQGIFIEALCTAELVFTIIMLAKEKHKATYIAPVGIGLSLFIGELVAVYYTGGSLNPARSFGPSAVTHTFSKNDWIYWVGPLIGSLLAIGFYWVIKVLEYEMANPGQDGDAKNDPTRNPEHDLAMVVEERAAEVEELRVVEEEGDLGEVLDDLTDNESVVGMEGVGENVEMRTERGSSPMTSPTGLLGKIRSRKTSRSSGQGSVVPGLLAKSPSPEAVVEEKGKE